MTHFEVRVRVSFFFLDLGVDLRGCSYQLVSRRAFLLRRVSPEFHAWSHAQADSDDALLSLRKRLVSTFARILFVLFRKNDQAAHQLQAPSLTRKCWEKRETLHPNDLCPDMAQFSVYVSSVATTFSAPMLRETAIILRPHVLYHPRCGPIPPSMCVCRRLIVLSRPLGVWFCHCVLASHPCSVQV